jgi:hydroxymethylpyrimidine pyrophosphatase-like HAD family hydrolase
VDITRKGIDKAYGVNQLMAALDLELEDLLFVGDRLDEGGNDYPVKAMGVECVAVHNWQDTAAYLTRLLETLPQQPALDGRAIAR